MSSDGPSKTKKEKKETNTINPKTVIAIKIYVRSMFLIFHIFISTLSNQLFLTQPILHLMALHNTLYRPFALYYANHRGI